MYVSLSKQLVINSSILFFFICLNKLIRRNVNLFLVGKEFKIFTRLVEKKL